MNVPNSGIDLSGEYKVEDNVNTCSSVFADLDHDKCTDIPSIATTKVSKIIWNSELRDDFISKLSDGVDEYEKWLKLTCF